MGIITLSDASKHCKFCGAVFYPRYGEGSASWGKRQYCSKACYRADERRTQLSIRDRLFDAVEPIPECGCWIWMKATTNGYGVISIGRKTKKAARVAYEEFIGPIPPGMVLRSVCWNALCINPAHLSPVRMGEQAAIAWSEGRGNPVVFKNLQPGFHGVTNAEKLARTRAVIEAHPVLANIKFRSVSGGYKIVEGKRIPIDPLKERA